MRSKISEIIRDEVDMIIVDEASRVHEVDVIALVGKYPSALSKILCGDSLQLPPTVVHRGDLSAQYGVPLQTRLTANGTPAALLTTKYRMDPEIMAILNKVAYNGKLVAHESTMAENRAIMKRTR